MVTRRKVITAGAVGGLSLAVAAAGGYGLIEQGILQDASGSTSCSDGTSHGPAVPTAAAGALVHGSFWSRRRGTEVKWTVGYPPGHHPGDELAVCIAIHGDTRTTPFPSTLHLDAYLAQAVDDGVPPFAIASIDGGSATNWHHGRPATTRRR